MHAHAFFKVCLVLIFLNTIVEKPWTLNLLFLYQFHAQKALFKVPKICNIIPFLDWKWPPPPLELFQKFIRFGSGTLPLYERRFQTQLIHWWLTIIQTTFWPSSMIVQIQIIRKHLPPQFEWKLQICKKKVGILGLVLTDGLCVKALYSDWTSLYFNLQWSKDYYC